MLSILYAAGKEVEVVRFRRCEVERVLTVMIAVESVNFEAPLVTELRAETECAGQGRLAVPWARDSQTAQAEDDLNSALDEALENYDLATHWMETDGDKEVVRK